MFNPYELIKCSILDKKEIWENRPYFHSIGSIWYGIHKVQWH